MHGNTEEEGWGGKTATGIVLLSRFCQDVVQHLIFLVIATIHYKKPADVH